MQHKHLRLSKEIYHDTLIADGKMIVKGNVQSTDDADTFLFKGIAGRNFTRAFALDDTVEVKDAAMLNGMLKIFLERIIPEHKKPKKIEVKDVPEDKPTSSKKGKAQLLTEDPLQRDL